MVNRKAAQKARTAGNGIPKRSDIFSVEEATIARVSRAISTIEDFLARWDATRTRPDDMFPQVVKVKQFHGALLNWQKDALKSMGKDDDEARLRRLRDFVMLCRTYS